MHLQEFEMWERKIRKEGMNRGGEAMEEDEVKKMNMINMLITMNMKVI